MKVIEATDPLMDGRGKCSLQGQSLCNTHPHVPSTNSFLFLTNHLLWSWKWQTLFLSLLWQQCCDPWKHRSLPTWPNHIITLTHTGSERQAACSSEMTVSTYQMNVTSQKTILCNTRNYCVSEHLHHYKVTWWQTAVLILKAAFCYPPKICLS